LLLQPVDEGADDTPTTDQTSPSTTASLQLNRLSSATTLHGPASTSLQVDPSQAGTRSAEVTAAEKPNRAAVKNHTLCTLTDHTSPVSPSSVDDSGGGDQRLSTPGATSSGYGSAASGSSGYVSAVPLSSDDLLGDHDDMTRDSSMVHDAGTNHSSMVPSAGVSIIDAAVPSDLDSPLKPTTPFTDEPAALPSTAGDTSSAVAVSTSGVDEAYYSIQQLGDENCDQQHSAEQLSAKTECDGCELTADTSRRALSDDGVSSSSSRVTVNGGTGVESVAEVPADSRVVSVDSTELSQSCTVKASDVNVECNDSVVTSRQSSVLKTSARRPVSMTITEDVCSTPGTCLTALEFIIRTYIRPFTSPLSRTTRVSQ